MVMPLYLTMCTAYKSRNSQIISVEPKIAMVKNIKSLLLKVELKPEDDFLDKALLVNKDCTIVLAAKKSLTSAIFYKLMPMK
jgi:hypothetical protein